MSQVVIVGCGVIGAAIAYELSKVSGLDITVVERQTPALESTGAALGVLMGAISKKVKGKAWQLRQRSMQRYETLIPELEAKTGLCIPFNRTGILMLHFADEDLASWEELVKIRQSQNWTLEIWDAQTLHSRCPQLQYKRIAGAIYSPQDRQVDPTALTQALVVAAQTNGVTFRFGVTVEGVQAIMPDDADLRVCRQVHTSNGALDVDWLVVAAGLGSLPLTTALEQPVKIQPVLGQALHLQLPQPLGCPDFQPVITGDDVHIVPVGERDYWIGATVEFPHETGEAIAQPALLELVRQQAIAFCPALAEATILRSWCGKRPRPEGRPAPIIEPLSGYRNVLLATGHYRNGILLAPVSAQVIREQMTR
jgi:glycine/D-amino acid oxidase-like deaminating enzyme